MGLAARMMSQAMRKLADVYKRQLLDFALIDTELGGILRQQRLEHRRLQQIAEHQRMHGRCV